MKRVYTWSGHGNLGDDWLGEVGLQHLDARVVTEGRCLHPRCAGRYCLSDRHPGTNSQLVLWGGGWLAADRVGSTTVTRWQRHLRAERVPVWGFGLGLGPFRPASRDDARAIDEIFHALSGRLIVRTPADMNHLPPGETATVGCDVSLLDSRFFPTSPATRELRTEASSPLVASFPRYSSHWVADRPWMTEAWYVEWVRSAVAEHGRGRTTVFAEFDSAPGSAGDAEYWNGLCQTTARPRGVMDAAALFRDAATVLAGRLHAAVLAAVVGTPTVALAYHHKFGVVDELGIPTVGLTQAPDVRCAPASAHAATLAAVRRRGFVQLERLTADLTSGTCP